MYVYIKPCKWWDKNYLSLNWCRIFSINSMTTLSTSRCWALSAKLQPIGKWKILQAVWTCHFMADLQINVYPSAPSWSPGPKSKLLGNPGRFSSAMLVLECILQGRDRGSLPAGNLENPLLKHGYVGSNQVRTMVSWLPFAQSRCQQQCACPNQKSKLISWANKGGVMM